MAFVDDEMPVMLAPSRSPRPCAPGSGSIATSSAPVGFFRPPPIRPMALRGRPRNAASRSTHCSCNCRRCTSTSVLTPRSAMSQAATTVFPKAVVAERTPVSWASMASAASCCSGYSSPRKFASSGLPAKRSSRMDGLDVQVRQKLYEHRPGSRAASRCGAGDPRRRR